MPIVSLSNSQDKKETEVRLPVVYGYVGNKKMMSSSQTMRIQTDSHSLRCTL